MPTGAPVSSCWTSTWAPTISADSAFWIGSMISIVGFVILGFFYLTFDTAYFAQYPMAKAGFAFTADGTIQDAWYMIAGSDMRPSVTCFIGIILAELLITPTGIGRHHLLDGEADPTVVIAEVTRALREAPIDLACVGVGENGHLAFNEPPADFTTPEAFLVVALDDVSRVQ